MAGHALRRTVQDHQPFFGYDHFQGGRFPENAQPDRPDGLFDLRKGRLKSAFSAGFLFRRQRQDEGVWLGVGGQAAVGFNERHDGPAVVT